MQEERKKKFINNYCEKKTFILPLATINRANKNLQQTQSLHTWKFFSKLHVQRVSYWINFIIFRLTEQPILNKLA